MSTTENKYQRGKIYKLISNETNDVYYGSTIEDKLTNRLSGHRKNYKQFLNGKCSHITSFEIIKFDNAKIILVENYPCNTKYELLAREQQYIDNNVCVNKQRAYSGMTHPLKFNCECGSSFSKQHKVEHLRTKKHIKYLETKTLA